MPLSHLKICIRVDIVVHLKTSLTFFLVFFFQAEDGIRDYKVTGVQTCALPISLRHGSRLILASHLGRPKGQANPKMSLRSAAERLRSLLDQKLGEDCNVGFATDCVGVQAEEMANNLEPGQTLLLENLRFHPEEEKNDPGFAKKLASLAELYVNDAFGSAHRAHASTEGITHFIKKSAAGFLMEKELKYLAAALENPQRPFVA